ncbi:IS701 family transposase [Streptomyces sp. NPDC101227]|uniref:IS701 family transposase n=1 Tax=Streptomyces sp. NPDC101227 TaxID=3366136 RepID=UPI00381F952E
MPTGSPTASPTSPKDASPEAIPTAENVRNPVADETAAVHIPPPLPPDGGWEPPVAGGRPTPRADDAQLSKVLAELGERIGPLFARPEPRAQAMQYALGLLADGGRSNTWQLAQRVGDSSPWRMQRLLTRARWDAAAVQDTVCGYLAENLGHPEAMLVLGQSDALKKGAKTVAAARQYTELTRRVENCQTAVMTAYISPHGRALMDRELLLPESWTDDPQRCIKAGVPEERLAYRTKPELARTMIERVMGASVPFQWVCGGQDYGQDEALRGWLEEQGIRYVFAVPARRLGAASAAAAIPKQRWWPSPGVPGEPGTVPGRWSRLTVPNTSHWGPAAPPCDGFTRSLLLHRRPDAARTDCYLVHAPRGTNGHAMVTAAAARCHARRHLDEARLHTGLDRHEIRTWTAWYRHITLSLLAMAAHTVALGRAG